jgi:DNA excision repair protein ERCC-6
LILSGAPLQNSLLELWALFNWITPGKLGSREAFEAQFSMPIRQGGYTNASAVDSAVARQRCVALRAVIAPYLLRRLKTEVAKGKALPPKTEHVLFCRLSDAQIEAYKNVITSNGVRDIVRGGRKAFGAISLLRQICNHADLARSSVEYDTANGAVEDFGAPERSGKLLVLREILPLWHAQ